MTEVHLVLPAGYDDPHRPSGGNIYDHHVSTGLTGLGWTVVVHEVTDAWPTSGPAIADAVDHALSSVPAEQVVVVDGLLGSAAVDALVRHASRLRLVALVHMPGAPGGPPGSVLRASRLVITTSEWTARSLIEHHSLPAGHVLVATPGAPYAEPAPGTARGEALLCVAPITAAKGHDLLVAALAGVASQPWSCVCVGALDREPDFVRQIRAQLVDSGIADRMQFTGALVGADLDRAYAAADVLVLPTRLESYGMVVTEALAHGLPVIATSVGGVPEALGHAGEGRRPGILVQPDDVQALGGAITQWLRNPTVRDELRSAARDRRALLSPWVHTVTTISQALALVADG